MSRIAQWFSIIIAIVIVYGGLFVLITWSFEHDKLAAAKLALWTMVGIPMMMMVYAVMWAWQRERRRKSNPHLIDDREGRP
jgi:hypothetical protein